MSGVESGDQDRWVSGTLVAATPLIKAQIWQKFHLLTVLTHIGSGYIFWCKSIKNSTFWPPEMIGEIKFVLIN